MVTESVCGSVCHIIQFHNHDVISESQITSCHTSSIISALISKALNVKTLESQFFATIEHSGLVLNVPTDKFPDCDTGASPHSRRPGAEHRVGRVGGAKLCITINFLKRRVH